MLLFKVSAAAATTNKNSEEGLFNSTEFLIQFMSDNFSAHINSPNGLKTTHAIALLATLCASTHATEQDSFVQDEMIPTLSLNEAKDECEADIEHHWYTGPHQPSMPDEITQKPILTHHLVENLHMSLTHARMFDHMFF